MPARCIVCHATHCISTKIYTYSARRTVSLTIFNLKYGTSYWEMNIHNTWTLFTFFFFAVFGVKSSMATPRDCGPQCIHQLELFISELNPYEFCTSLCKTCLQGNAWILNGKNQILSNALTSSLHNKHSISDDFSVYVTESRRIDRYIGNNVGSWADASKISRVVRIIEPVIQDGHWNKQMNKLKHPYSTFLSLTEMLEQFIPIHTLQ